MLAVTSNGKSNNSYNSVLGLYLTPEKQQPVSEWTHTPRGSKYNPNKLGGWVGMRGFE